MILSQQNLYLLQRKAQAWRISQKWVITMRVPTIAAIDVGTNAMRLVVGSINDDHRIELLENIREPVRLGKDVFAKGTISEETTERAIEAFQKFKRLIDKYGVEHVKAVATSATREALNSDIFVDRIAQATLGVSIAEMKTAFATSPR